MLQWLPLAGAIGAARRSPPTGLLLGVWVGAFALAYGASPNVGIGDVTLVQYIRAGAARVLAVGRLRAAAGADGPSASGEMEAKSQRASSGFLEWSPAQSKYASQCRAIGPVTRMCKKRSLFSSPVR